MIISDNLIGYSLAANVLGGWVLGLAYALADWKEHTPFGRFVLMTVFGLGGAAVGAIIALVGNILLRFFEFAAIVFHVAPAVLMA